MYTNIYVYIYIYITLSVSLSADFLLLPPPPPLPKKNSTTSQETKRDSRMSLFAALYYQLSRCARARVPFCRGKNIHKSQVATKSLVLELNDYRKKIAVVLTIQNIDQHSDIRGAEQVSRCALQH